MEALSKNKQKWVRSLRLKKNRDKENCFVIEGKKLVTEVIDSAPELIQLVCCTTNESDGSFLSVTESEMKELSSFSSPSTHLAVVAKPTITNDGNKITLVVDGVQDPGNLGTIIRTADWFGIDNIICSNESVDVFNPKVVQATMGSIMRVKVAYTDLPIFFSKSDLPVYGAVMDGDDLYQSKDLKLPAYIVVGNEGNGISDAVLQCIDRPISIPRARELKGPESLNVAIATGVILSYFQQKAS